MPPSEFAYEEETQQDPRLIITVYGDKGVGKTTFSLGVPGKKYVISLDGKSLRVKQEVYGNDPNVVVLNGIKYLSHEPSKFVESGKRTYDYIMFLVAEVAKKGDADWIVFDATEQAEECSEMVMRYDNKLGPFEGFANLNLWKTRKLLLRSLHEAATNAVKRGVIYTIYLETREITKQGVRVNVQEPKWVDIIKWATDVVVRVWAERRKDGVAFQAQIESSKVKEWPTGLTMDVTGKRISDMLQTSAKAADEAKKALADVFA